MFWCLGSLLEPELQVVVNCRNQTCSFLRAFLDYCGFFIYFVYACGGSIVHHGIGVEVTGHFQDMFLSFHCVGPWIEFRMLARLGNSCLYPLNRLSTLLCKGPGDVKHGEHWAGHIRSTFQSCFLFAVLGVEPRDSHRLSKISITEPSSHPIPSASHSLKTKQTKTPKT